MIYIEFYGLNHISEERMSKYFLSVFAIKNNIGGNSYPELFKITYISAILISAK